jgi:hypothetical protein
MSGKTVTHLELAEKSVPIPGSGKAQLLLSGPYCLTVKRLFHRVSVLGKSSAVIWIEHRLKSV